VTSESDVDTCIISFASNRPRNGGLYSTSLISSTFGSRYLIRKYRTDEVRVHGCPVRYWGSRYGTDGLLTWLVSFHLFSQFQVLMARVYTCFPHQLWEVCSEHHLFLSDRVGKLYEFLKLIFSIG
jgi:hypothetical protein